MIYRPKPYGLYTKPNYDEDDDIKTAYAIHIPRAYARGENNKVQYEPEKVDHYKLFIVKQIGGNCTRKPTYIYWELPKSKKLVAIELYPDGGLDFKKDEHKYIIRETDELDRRIILGFCRKYSSSLINACHSQYKPDDLGLKNSAKYYRASDMPKRIKHGKPSTNFDWWYKRNNMLEPYEECGIFSKLQFI